MKRYTELCAFYGVRPNVHVLIALRYDLPHLSPGHTGGRAFRDHDLLPLCDLLLQLGDQASHITSISFRGCRLRPASAGMLAKLVAQLPRLASLDLTGNRLGSDGCVQLADALERSRTLRELRMRGCDVSSPGADSLSLALARPPPRAPLELVDLSNNRLGYFAKVALERVVKHRDEPISINLNGNLILVEVLNALTHGGGAVGAALGSIELLRRVRHAPQPLRVGCLVFCVALTACYSTSTIFHSSFLLGPLRHYFHIADQCSIYLLIAGSYTPFMLALFPTRRAWSVGFLVYIWTLAVAGVVAEVVFHRHREQSRDWLKFASLLLYVMMGWSVMFPPLLRDITRAMEPRAFRLLVAGGLAYTLGIPTFVRNRNLDHALWHGFVLAGSAFHYASLLLVVQAALRGTL